MNINMNNLPTGSICQMEEFLKSNDFIKMEITSPKDRYDFIKEVLNKIHYRKLKKKEKMLVIKYLSFLTKYSKTHLKHLVKLWKEGKMFFSTTRDRHRFPVKYFASDIAKLIASDVAHRCLNGFATKEVMRREFEVFGKKEYANIAEISVSHLYNLRNHNLQYESSEALFFKPTPTTSVNIGIRRKPLPYGKPGYLRVDSVHQGDKDGVKGVYHINIIDEVTQYEMIATVAGISEFFLKPVIEELLLLFPFKIYELHSDNGSEYINKEIAKLLLKLVIEQSKSRARKTNDNALVEGKNGSIIRKLFGRNFIDQKFAPLIYEFDKKYVNVYLIYHRPCQFAKEEMDRLGKVRKKYDTAMTPYEKLKSLENAEQHLKEGVTFAELDKLAYCESDNEFGKKLVDARQELMTKISKDLIK